MKKILLVGVGLLVFLSNSLCFAKGFQNEPNGFRGIKWGTDIKTLKDMKYLINYEDVIDMYSRDKDKLFFGKAKIGSIHYIFYMKCRVTFFMERVSMGTIILEVIAPMLSTVEMSSRGPGFIFGYVDKKRTYVGWDTAKLEALIDERIHQE